MKKFLYFLIMAVVSLASPKVEAQIVTPADIPGINLMEGPNWTGAKRDTLVTSGTKSLKKRIDATTSRISVAATAFHSTGTTTLDVVIRASNDGTNFYPVFGGVAADTFRITAASTTGGKIFDLPISTIGVRTWVELLFIAQATQSTPVQGVIRYVK